MTAHLEIGEAPRIVVVEDDISLANLIGEYLTQHDFRVSLFHRGEGAADFILGCAPDLLILDIMLPGVDGLQICREIRRSFKNPILLLTARTEEVDEIRGLDHGAHDYLRKPVRPRVLLARIKALLRRQSPPKKTTLLCVGQLVANTATRTVMQGSS